MRFSKEVLPFVKTIEFPRLFRVLRNDGIGRTIPIPLPVADGKILSYGRYLRGVVKFRAWKGQRLSNGHLFIPPLNFEATNFHYFGLLASEWHQWESYYLPPGGVKGMTVLDAGAACGDTAMFFIFKGAKKVISIEPDPERFACLKRNVAANGWNVEMINDIFRVEHLGLPFDFAKVDVELGELFMLKLGSLPPCVIETHGEEICEAFVKRFGMKRIKKDRRWDVVTNCRT